ncbi:SPOR domain-containing protein [Fluviicola sp.]|jgi:cell division septation protein DedD|uniref:SPOR domain-containing protein n=1 Tax=Fluviicola sp. TaxID=1917219 RepID=UPI0028292A4D|nr:SPOR domain-containing protein [Fluviicola sp.]MDR0803081.1 SPOR domain-containing protein [Fluviicola sp.]
MNNYLLQLLKEVKTLIIPGLGALTVTNENTGEIMFMPYLKFDDGTLAKHIASKENMEINDASNMISKFVREVTAELDKGNSYDMYLFGKFLKIDGEIAFEAWNSGNSDEPVKEEPKAEPVKPVAGEQKSEPVKASEQVAPKVTETPLPKTEIPVEKPEEKIPVAAIPKPQTIIEIPAKEEQVIPLIVEKTELKTPVEKEVPKKENVVQEPKQKKKKPVLSYILWGFLVLILGSGIYIAIRFDSLKKDFPILAELAGENDNTAKGSKDVKVLEDEDGVNIDSNTKSEPVPDDQVKVMEDQLPGEKATEKSGKETTTPKPVKENTPKPATKPTVVKTPVNNSGSTPSASFDSSKSFHIIAGSFGSAENANKLAEKLRSQGFGNTSVALHNGMHRVSIKGFSTLNEATAEAAKIRGTVPGAWVLKL